MNKQIEDTLKKDKIFRNFLQRCENRKPLVFAENTNLSLDTIYHTSLSGIEKKLASLRTDDLYLNIYYLFKMMSDIFSTESHSLLPDKNFSLNQSHSQPFIHADGRAHNTSIYSASIAELEDDFYANIWSLVSQGKIVSAISYASEVKRSDYGAILHGAISEDPLQLTNWALIARKLTKSVSNDSERFVMMALSGDVQSLTNVLSPIHKLYYSVWSVILNIVSDGALSTPIKIKNELFNAIISSHIPFNIRLAAAYVCDDYLSLYHQEISAENLSLVISTILYKKSHGHTALDNILPVFCQQYSARYLSASTLFACASYVTPELLHNSLVKLLTDGSFEEQRELINLAVDASIPSDIIFSSLVAYSAENSSIDSLCLLSYHPPSRFAFMCNIILRCYNLLLKDDFLGALRIAETISNISTVESLYIFKELPAVTFHNLIHGIVAFINGHLQMKEQNSLHSSNLIMRKYKEFMVSLDAHSLIAMLDPAIEDYISICTSVYHPFPSILGVASLILQKISNDIAVLTKAHPTELFKPATDFFRMITENEEIMSIVKDSDRHKMVESLIDIGQMRVL